MDNCPNFTFSDKLLKKIIEVYHLTSDKQKPESINKIINYFLSFIKEIYWFNEENENCFNEKRTNQKKENEKRICLRIYAENTKLILDFYRNIIGDNEAQIKETNFFVLHQLKLYFQFIKITENHIEIFKRDN